MASLVEGDRVGARQERIAQTRELNFGPFSKSPEYRKEIRDLLRVLVPLFPDNFTLVDVGAGTGLAERLLIPLCHEYGKKGTIFAIEPDEFVLRRARRNTPRDSHVKVEYIQGYGENLRQLLAGKIPEEGVDAAIMLDAIHEVTGRDVSGRLRKDIVVEEMAAVTKEGGFGVWNTNFTTQGLTQEDGARQGRWFAEAYRLAGGGIRRDRKEIQADDQDDSTKFYAPEEYLDMFRRAGFTKIIAYRMMSVTLRRGALRGISEYPRFVDGAFERYEPNEGVKTPSLQEQSEFLKQALDKRGIKSLGRRWRDYILQKVPPPPNIRETSAPRREATSTTLSEGVESEVSDTEV